MIEDPATYPAELVTIAFPKRAHELRVQVVRDVLWYRGANTDPVMVVLVLVRDPAGQWWYEALVSTDPTASAEFVILRYCRRWSVDQAFLDSKQFLGLHDPRVCCLQSVERAYPMARFLGTRTILWHSLKGHEGSHAIKDRPWYDKKVTPTFADMLGRCGCRCGSRRFMESSPSDHPHRNPSNSCCAGSPPLRESPKL